MNSSKPPNGAPGSRAEPPSQADGAPAAPAAEADARPRTLLSVLRQFGPLLLIVAVSLLVFAMGWHRHVTFENIVALRDRFQVVLDEHRALSIFIYTAIYVAAASLSLPGCPILTVTGGLLFGWLVGGLATVVGATIGATILFLIARTAVGNMLSGQATPWLAKLREGFRRDALSYLLFLRLVPAFPFWFVNVAPAVLGVPLRTYVIGTFLGIIPATFAFASAGVGLDSVIRVAKADYAECVARAGAGACKLTIHASSIVTRELVLALLLLGVVALIPVAFRKRRSRHAAAK
jgi:uncharacterized membrane protein YdjX (TVP38/TMEM64 family)